MADVGVDNRIRVMVCRVSFRIFVKGGGVAKATIADLRGGEDYSSIVLPPLTWSAKLKVIYSLKMSKTSGLDSFLIRGEVYTCTCILCV